MILVDNVVDVVHLVNFELKLALGGVEFGVELAAHCHKHSVKTILLRSGTGVGYSPRSRSVSLPNSWTGRSVINVGESLL